MKLLVNNKNQILWMTRSDSPCFFNLKTIFKKHLSVIVFNYKTLINYSELKTSYFEKIESIELLRALENGFKLSSNTINQTLFQLILKTI